MAVRKREYNDEYGRPVWGYDFSYRRERYRNAGYATKEEALIAEAGARQKAMAGQKRIQPTSLAAIIKEFIELREGIKAPNTTDREKRRARVILKYFPDKILSQITRTDIERHIKTRIKEEKAPRTINLELTFLSSLFKYAISHGYAFDNPVKGVEFPKVIKMKRSLPTDEEFSIFIEEAGKTATGKQLVAWVFLEMYTGLRPNESFHLEWPDMNFEKDIIDIQPKINKRLGVDNRLKNGQYRPIEIHPALKPILLEWQKEWNAVFEKEGRKHNWIFFNPRRHYLRAKGFRKCFEQAKAAANKRLGKTREEDKIKLTPYILRHFFISKAVMNGINRYTIKDWVGHSSTRMIDEYYSHLDHDFKMGEMNKLDIGVRKVS